MRWIASLASLLVLFAAPFAAAGGPIAVKDPSEPNLVLARGTIGSDGTVDAGAGFTVAHPECGVYTVTYNTPFGGDPTVVVSARRPAVEGGVQIGILNGPLASGPGGFTVFVNQPIRRALSGAVYYGMNTPLLFNGNTFIAADGSTATLGPGIILGHGNLLSPGVVQIQTRDPLTGVVGFFGDTATIDPPFTNACVDTSWDFMAIGPK